MLSITFGVSPRTLTRIYDAYASGVAFIFKHLFPMPTMSELIAATPTSILESSRAGQHCHAATIGDFSERYFASPSATSLFKFLHSNYKKHRTVKVLVVVTGCGFVIHVSVWAPGTDDELLRASCIAEQLKGVMAEGDMLTFLYDKGMEETHEFDARGIFVDIPSTRAQPHQKLYTEESGIASKRTSSGRILIEHINANLKDYRAISETGNLSTIDMVGHEFQVAAGLCNLLPCHSDNWQQSAPAALRIKLSEAATAAVTRYAATDLPGPITAELPGHDAAVMPPPPPVLPVLCPGPSSATGPATSVLPHLIAVPMCGDTTAPAGPAFQPLAQAIRVKRVVVSALPKHQREKGKRICRDRSFFGDDD